MILIYNSKLCDWIYVGKLQKQLPSTVQSLQFSRPYIQNSNYDPWNTQLFSKSIIPYQLRDDNKLIQPLKRTTSFGIKYFAYFGTHLWNMLPQHIKNSVSLYNFKSLIRKWSGPTCCCSVCTQVVWFVTVFINLYYDICFFLYLLGYIWKTLLSLVAFYIFTRLFLFYRLNLFIVICKKIYLDYLT